MNWFIAVTVNLLWPAKKKIKSWEKPILTRINQVAVHKHKRKKCAQAVLLGRAIITTVVAVRLKYLYHPLWVWGDANIVLHG